MAAEAGRAPETLQLRHGAEDRLVVGGRLVKAGPRGLDPGRSKGRRPKRSLLEHLLQELPIHVRRETGRLGPVAHPDQNAVALGMEVKRRLKVHRHRIAARHSGERPGHGYMTAVRQDRYLQTRPATDRGRPRAGAVEPDTRRAGARGRTPALAAATAA